MTEEKDPHIYPTYGISDRKPVEWPVSFKERLEKLNKEKEKLQEENKRTLSSCVSLFGYNPYQYGIEDVIPEVARLAETTCYKYRDILRLCQEYGEGYKELIQKHIEAGTTHKALEEMELAIRIRIVDEWLKRENSKDKNDVPFEVKLCEAVCEKKNKEELIKLEEEIDKQPLININEIELKKNSKEYKLPKKYRRGWK